MLGPKFGVAVSIPPVRGSFADLAALERRMATAADIGQGVSDLLIEVVAISDRLQPLLAQFNANGSDQQDWTASYLETLLSEVDHHSTEAIGRAVTVRALLSDSGQASGLQHDLGTLIEVLEVIAVVGDAGRVGLSAIASIEAPDQYAGGGILGGDGRLLRVLDTLIDRQQEIRVSMDQLLEVEGRLEKLQASGDDAAVGGISDLISFSRQYRNGLHLLSSVASIGDDLLGRGSNRKYLVLGHSADELRATGGFVSSIWLVTVTDGKVESIQYHDAVRVDDYERIQLYPKAPLGLEEHLNAWVWLLRDVSWDPDFPTTALTAEDMFRLGQRQQVDGVIAINQWALLQLVEALGSIPGPEGGEPITPRNFLSVLEEGTDVHGRAYMDLTLLGVVDSMSKSVPLATLVRLAAGVHDSLDTRDLLLYFNSVESQTVIEDLGWSGSLAAGDRDYLFVVDSNVGWNKSDRSIQRDLIYRVDLSELDRPRASLTAVYVNHSGPGSPGCEPQWLARGTEYSRLKNACYWNFFRVYMPAGARVLSSTPLPLPDYSVSVEIGKGVPGEETGKLSSSHGKTVFSGLIEVGAGERANFVLTYDLPRSILKVDGDKLQYQVLIQKQPGMRQRGITVELTLPEGYHLSSSSIAPVSQQTKQIRFSLQQTRDILLTVEFARNADATS